MDWARWVEDEGGWGFTAGGEDVLAPMEYECGNGGRRGTKVEQCVGLGRLFEIWGKLQTLPPSKILDILRVGGRTVISGVPNVGGIDFGRAHGCLGAHGI